LGGVITLISGVIAKEGFAKRGKETRPSTVRVREPGKTKKARNGGKTARAPLAICQERKQKTALMSGGKGTPKAKKERPAWMSKRGLGTEASPKER